MTPLQNFFWIEVADNAEQIIASDNSSFRETSDKFFKANCNEHKAFMFFQDFLFFSKAALFFLPLPLGNVRAVISKYVAWVHTRKSTPKDKSATKHFPSYFNSASGRNRNRAYYLCAQEEASCGIVCQWNELSMQEKLIKKKVLWDLYLKQY